jgi:hypothetical protein
MGEPPKLATPDDAEIIETYYRRKQQPSTARYS